MANRKSLSENLWLAPEVSTVPDFIICGAMKAGTSTLHQILNHHPDIFIPDPEIHFFDIDDLLSHPDFFFCQGENWIQPDIRESPLDFWNWYSSFFEDSQPGQIIGEDSTVYMTSRRALERISLQDKHIKLIFSLRQPTDRAYSQYWHMVRTGRAIYNFEDTIQHEPDSILSRSLYSRHIKQALQYIPRDRIKFLIFEDFLNNKEAVLKDLCNFLGLDENLIPKTAYDLHSNRTTIPFNLKLKLLRNQFLRSHETFYLSHLPLSLGEDFNKKLSLKKILSKIHAKINPEKTGKIPKIHSGTKNTLDFYFQRELQDLSDLIDKDVTDLWFSHLDITS
ncbi:MAG: sulfotransferase [Thermosynechococcaceae cyanobacterium]